MGVVYKLKPEIKDFILEQKKSNLILSCRSLSALIENKFQTKVSKSSINSTIKEAGLSMPVGRRRKKRRRKAQIPAKPQLEIKTALPSLPLFEKPLQIPAPVEKQAEEPLPAPIQIPPPIPAEKPPEPPVETKVETPLPRECTGAILLKAVDCLVGGSHYITEAIKSRLTPAQEDLLAKTEALIYLPLFGSLTKPETGDIAGLRALVDKNFTLEEILSYHNELQKVKTIGVDLLRILPTILQEVHSIKAHLVGQSSFYLDGQLHTVWSTPHIPFDFSTTIYNIKSYINKYFYENEPLVLFMAPGYDTPTQEFFDFLSGLESQQKRITRLTLCGNKFQDLEVIPLEQIKRRCFIFGLWPWQFTEHRKVKAIGEFKPFYFEPMKKDFYLAEIEIELSQPNIKQSVTLKGCALKTSIAEKTRLVILSNLGNTLSAPENLANIYLSHWPNLEEAFQDFSRKIELFTYTASAQRYFSSEGLNLSLVAPSDIGALFSKYLEALDSYFRWHFLPLGYEDVDFSTTKERFYNLKAKIEKEKEKITIAFNVPSSYPYLKDLVYLCCRINERQVTFKDGKRLWFTPRSLIKKPLS